MVTTVTLNPCIDRTVFLDELKVGATNKVKSSRSDPSGKGINTSVVLNNLNVSTFCVGINYKNGAILTDFLDSQGIPYDFAIQSGSLRTNIKLLHGNVMTELNELGDHVDSKTLSICEEKIISIASKSDIIVFSGSVPSGVPQDFYAKMISKVRRDGLQIILDASGAMLKNSITSGIFMVKPNIAELSELCGTGLSSESQIISAARSLISQGIQYICVSLGEKGAMLISDRQVYFSPALKLDIQGLQGAGDSMVGGICLAMRDKLPAEDMLKYGCAAASASITKPGTSLCSLWDFSSYLPLIHVECM